MPRNLFFRLVRGICGSLIRSNWCRETRPAYPLPNGGKMADPAGRYTEERADNFDIYLPLWLARHNKTMFGAVFIASELFVLVMRRNPICQSTTSVRCGLVNLAIRLFGSEAV